MPVAPVVAFRFFPRSCSSVLVGSKSCARFRVAQEEALHLLRAVDLATTVLFSSLGRMLRSRPCCSSSSSAAFNMGALFSTSWRVAALAQSCVFDASAHSFAFQYSLGGLIGRVLVQTNPVRVFRSGASLWLCLPFAELVVVDPCCCAMCFSCTIGIDCNVPGGKTLRCSHTSFLSRTS